MYNNLVSLLYYENILKYIDFHVYRDINNSRLEQ